MKEYFEYKTAEEAEQRLTEVGIPCSLLMDFEKMENHPHYLARECFMEWPILSGEKFKGTTIIPLFKNNPGQVWRGTPTTGLDNEEVLHDLGLSDDAIRALYEQKVIAKK